MARALHSSQIVALSVRDIGHFDYFDIKLLRMVINSTGTIPATYQSNTRKFTDASKGCKVNTSVRIPVKSTDRSFNHSRTT